MDRVRFVQRVARAVRSSADRGGPLRLRLSPPELGALRLEVQLRSGVLTARLEAETPAARALLLENLPQLRERLAEQNVQVGRFDVELLGSSPDGPGGRQAADARAQQPQWTQLGGRRKPLAAQMPLPDAPGGRPGAAAGQLNVII
jgi:flagellar hook-length control protein FliK